MNQVVATPDLAQRIGGKAAKLARMQSLGFNVPAWFAIEASDFEQALVHRDVTAARERAEKLVREEDFEGAGAAMRASVEALPIDAAFSESVVEQWRQMGSPMVAVRSSAIGEDGAEHSYAGQFDSVLGVRSEAQLIDAIRTCWASAWTGRAIAYRHRHKLGALEAAMGLVVQVQIDADSAGVMFTGDPITGDPLVTVISATWGLGEALVSGIANADTYRVDRRSAKPESRGDQSEGEITAEIADKDVKIVLAENGLTEEATVADDRRNERVLRDDQIAQLAKIGRQLEEHEGCAQDVEWALEGEQLHILQTRPVTTSLRPAGTRRTWDNSNIVESYSGVVSPLTFSFAREAYTNVYFQAIQLLRLPKQEMATANIVVRQMLGYIDGRVYYNLASWYYLLSVMPNYESNAAAMEQMMGVRAPLDGTIAPPANASRKVRMYGAMVWQLLRINRSITKFRDHVHGVLNRYERDLDTLNADELVDAYDELRTDLLGSWQVPIINDVRVMMSFDRLRKQNEQLGIDESGTLQNDLMCGQGKVESAEPTYMLVRMAERIRANSDLRAVIFETDDAELRDVIRAMDDADARFIDEQLDEYLRRFGDRCANELKLETPTLRENPAFLYSVIRNFVRQEDLTEAKMLAHETEIRDAAEIKVHEALSKRGGPLAGIRKRMFHWVLAQARNAVRDREALRFDRTRVFGLSRRIFAALGHRFVEQGLLDSPRDIFYLEVDEIIGTVQGTTTTRDLRALAAIRRMEAAEWLEHDLPDRIDTIGTTNANPRDDAYAATDVSGDSMSGIGCCPGVVEQPVRVVHSPDQGVTLDGNIMACTRTDPGWIPLFPSCGGLLVERGSLLSHSAIVAREFGIPAIVGIPGLMQWAVDGETVRMDGAQGIVSRSESEPE